VADDGSGSPDTGELRGQTPKSILAVIDAVAIAKRKNRIDIVNHVMLAWAKEQVHLATVIANTTRGNPPLPDTDWGRLE
jgi:hypothetical protein